jgi:hypothetical protein
LAPVIHDENTAQIWPLAIKVRAGLEREMMR